MFQEEIEVAGVPHALDLAFPKLSLEKPLSQEKMSLVGRHGRLGLRPLELTVPHTPTVTAEKGQGTWARQRE